MAPLNVNPNLSKLQDTNEYEVDYDKNVTRLYESISSSDWDVALSALKHNSDEARTWVVRYHEDEAEGIMWRFLPIHSACARQPPEFLIASLLRAYPKGAAACDDQGMYPLHYACGNQASPGVIQSLLLAYPEAANLADPNGMLPIHYMAQWGPSTTRAIHIIIASSSTVDVKDLDGNAPIDLAKLGDYPERDELISALQKVKDIRQEFTQKNANGQRNLGSVNGMSISSKFDDLIDESSTEASESINLPPRQEDIVSTSTMKALAKLNAEVAKLQAEAAFVNAELEEKLLANRETMDKQIEDVKLDLARSQQETKDVKTDILAKEDFAQYVESRLEEKDKELTIVLEENKQLSEDLDDSTKTFQGYKEKAELLEERMRTISNSMRCMIDEQERIIAGTSRLEEELKVSSELRKKKLQSILEQEKLFSNELGEIKRTDGVNGPTVQGALENQKEMMNNIATVLTECADLPSYGDV